MGEHRSKGEFGSGALVVLVFLIALVVGLVYGGSQGWFDDFNFGFIDIDIDSQSPDGVAPPASVPTVDSRIDLCSLATPYLLDLGSCDAAGGVFTCTFSEVSCIGSTVAIPCGGAVALAGQVQCNAVGGNWHCDAANVWCRY